MRRINSKHLGIELSVSRTGYFWDIVFLPMENAPVPRVVKLGDLLPAFSNFETVLSSLKSYSVWPAVLREALLDRAISGVACTQEELESTWIDWCVKNGVDPAQPLFEGLSPAEIRKAALRELQVEKFKEQAFGRLLPEYFRSRKRELDRIELEIARFHHRSVAEEALFRCREGEQTLEQAAHELAHRDGGEPPVKRMGPMSAGRLGVGVSSLLAGARPGEFRGPKKVGQFQVIVKVIGVTEGALDQKTRRKLLGELLENWLEQQMTAMTGRPPRPRKHGDDDSFMPAGMLT